MWLNKYIDNIQMPNFTKLGKESSTYNAFYEYWLESLFERVMRLFVWENTYEVPAKEIEQRLIMIGHAGIAKYGGKLTAFYGSFSGPTVYYDEFTKYTVHSPLYSDTLKIDDEVVVVSNNALKNPVYPLLHHYAVELAHIDVSLVSLAINSRESGGVPIVQTEKQKQSVEAYLSKLYNGQYGIVSDPAMLGVQWAGGSKNTSQSIVDMQQIKEKTLKSFYQDIGVRSAFEKRSNSVESEVEADTSLLLLNLSDMLASRQKACDDVNKAFGTNWSVHIAEEIQYGLENDPEMRGEEVEADDIN